MTCKVGRSLVRSHRLLLLVDLGTIAVHAVRSWSWMAFVSNVEHFTMLLLRIQQRLKMMIVKKEENKRREDAQDDGDFDGFVVSDEEAKDSTLSD